MAVRNDIPTAVDLSKLPPMLQATRNPATGNTIAGDARAGFAAARPGLLNKALQTGLTPTEQAIMAQGAGFGAAMPINVRTIPEVAPVAAIPAPVVPAVAPVPATSAPITASMPRLNGPESGSIPATPFATPVAQSATSQALPAMPAYSPDVNPANLVAPAAQPGFVDPTDPEFIKKSNSASPFTDVFGNVQRGSWDDLFNTKLVGGRAKRQTAANLDAFNAGTNLINASSNVKQANDAPTTASARLATEVATNAATNATSRLNNLETTATAAANNAADITSRNRNADISADAINKQSQIRPIGQHLEGPVGAQVPVTDYGMVTMDASGKPVLSPVKAPSASVGTNLPPAGHIAALKNNPALKADFDAMYGAGAADNYLGK